MTSDHDQRPWGEYLVLDEATDYKVKRITVLPGKRLSYQRHARRQEHWFVVSGAGRVTLEGEEFDVLPGLAVEVPTGAAHRIANPGSSTPRSCLSRCSVATTSAKTTLCASKTISGEPNDNPDRNNDRSSR